MGEPAIYHVGLGKKRDFIAETFLRAADNQEGPGFDTTDIDCYEPDEALEPAFLCQREAENAAHFPWPGIRIC
jgi:hypothetical protein